MQNRMNWNHRERDPIQSHIQGDNSGFQKHLHDGDLEKHGVIILFWKGNIDSDIVFLVFGLGGGACFWRFHHLGLNFALRGWHFLVIYYLNKCRE